MYDNQYVDALNRHIESNRKFLKELESDLEGIQGRLRSEEALLRKVRKELARELQFEVSK